VVNGIGSVLMLRFLQSLRNYIDGGSALLVVPAHLRMYASYQNLLQGTNVKSGREAVAVTELIIPILIILFLKMFLRSGLRDWQCRRHPGFWIGVPIVQPFSV
jgi:hypothetical protein